MLNNTSKIRYTILMLQNSIVNSTPPELCTWSFLTTLKTMETERLSPGFSLQFSNRDSMSALANFIPSRGNHIPRDYQGQLSPEGSYYNREFFTREMQARNVPGSSITAFYGKVDELVQEVKNLLDKFTKSCSLETQAQISGSVNNFIMQVMEMDGKNLFVQFRELAGLQESEHKEFWLIVGKIDQLANDLNSSIADMLELATDPKALRE